MYKKYDPAVHITILQASEEFALSRKTIAAWAMKGEIPGSCHVIIGKRTKPTLVVPRKAAEYRVREHKARHESMYLGIVLPHQKILTFFIFQSKFSFDLAQQKANCYYLPFLSKKDYDLFAIFLRNRIKLVAPPLYQALRNSSNKTTDLEHPWWDDVFDNLGMSELYDDFDCIPWHVFSDYVARWHLDMCVGKLSNKETMDFFEQKFDIDLTEEHVKMYKKYIYNTFALTPLQVKIYLGSLHETEHQFKKQCIHMTPEIFKHHIGMSDSIDDVKVTQEQSMISDTLTIRKGLEVMGQGSLKDQKLNVLAKMSSAQRKDKWEARDRIKDTSGVQRTIDESIKLQYNVPEEVDAISIEDLEEPVTSKNMKKDLDGTSASAG